MEPRLKNSFSATATLVRSATASRRMMGMHTKWMATLTWLKWYERSSIKVGGSVEVSSEIVQVFDLVDSYNPVGRGECFLHHVELHWPVAWDGSTSDPVGSVTASVEVVEPVVRHLVQERLSHGQRGIFVDLVLASLGEVVSLVDLVGPHALGNPDHPQELVDVVTGVSQHTAENHKHVVYVVSSEDFVRHLLIGAHGLADGGDVGVVPGVVVDQGGSVGHATDSVSVIPPGHDFSVLWRVHAEPVVRLTEVVDDGGRAVGVSRCQHHRRRRVGVGGDPSTVQHKVEEVAGEREEHDRLGDQREQVEPSALGGAGVQVAQVEVDFKELGQGNGSAHTNHRRQRQHETHHDTGKVRAQHGVDDDKHSLVLEFLETEVDAGWEEPDEHGGVEEERRPGRGSVLRHRRDDRDVDLGVVGVPERVEPAGPWGNESQGRQGEKTYDSQNKHKSARHDGERLELLGADVHLDVVGGAHQSEEAENPKRSHVIVGSDGKKAHERDSHGRKRAYGVPRGVGGVELVVVAAHQDEHEDVERNQVGDENVSTPRRHHVEVEHGGDGGVEHGAALHGTDPEVERHHEQRDGDGLVIVRPSHRSGDVARRNGHEKSGKQPGAGLHLLGEAVGRERRQPGERRREKHTDVSDVDGNSEVPQGLPNNTTGHHQSGVQRAAGHTAQRVPGSGVEPVQKLVE